MPPSPLLRAVVFDLDGLMLNTEELYQSVGTELLGRRGCTFDAELLDRVMGRPSAVALQMMIEWHDLDVTVEEFAAESEATFVSLLDERLETMPGLLPLLEALERAELPRAIATSSGRRFTENVLGRFQLAPRFSFVLTSEDIEQGKPHPEMYLLASARLGLDPAEVLVLEDSQNGCRAAVAAGTFAVAVPGGHSRRHDFAGSRFVADSLADPRIYEALSLALPEM